MRPVTHRTLSAVLALLSLAACDTHPMAASSATASPSPPASVAAGRKPALGIGEPRIPQPFTVDQRLLDAASRGDRPTLERALEHGASITAKDDLGRSLVLLAVMDAGDLELVRWLKSKGAALDEPDVSGRTALSFAAAAGRLEVVRYLIDNGAAVDRTDVQQRTPLYHAASENHAAVVGILLDHGANPNTRDQFGDTPLIIACSKGNAETAALLLQRGADATLKDQEGRTAQERAQAGMAACVKPTAAPP